MKRQNTNRTGKLIQSLPANGLCVVIVWSEKEKQSMSHWIEEFRGKDYVQKVKLLIINCYADLVKLHGLTHPIYADHWVWENVGKSLKSGLNFYTVRGEEFV